VRLGLRPVANRYWPDGALQLAAVLPDLEPQRPGAPARGAASNCPSPLQPRERSRPRAQDRRNPKCLREARLTGERGAALAIVKPGSCFKGTFVPSAACGHLDSRRGIHCKHGDLHDYDEDRCEKPENPMSVHDLSPSVEYRLRPGALLTHHLQKGFKVPKGPFSMGESVGCGGKVSKRKM
jgi:hypothetical protein